MKSLFFWNRPLISNIIFMLRITFLFVWDIWRFIFSFNSLCVILFSLLYLLLYLILWLTNLKVNRIRRINSCSLFEKFTEMIWIYIFFFFFLFFYLIMTVYKHVFSCHNLWEALLFIISFRSLKFLMLFSWLLF